MDGEFPLFGHNRRSRYGGVDVGWIDSDDLELDEWVAIGEDLGRAERETPWAIGDWWNIGQRWDRERTELIHDEKRWRGPSHETCWEYGSVASTFEPLVRTKGLSYLHHRKAASLANADWDEAQRFLRAAATNGWSAAQLAQEIRLFRMRRQVRALPHAPPGSTDDNPWGVIQHFDIWQFQNADDDSDYFGKLPRQVAENLLWHFTDPGQLVFDPFAGGGIMLDVAEAMDRRIWASDLSPSRPTIHQHDITSGWPPDAPDAADLIFIDPPYWQQARERYSDKPDDLGNVSLAEFVNRIDETFSICAEHLTPNGRIAYIISPTYQNDGRVIDHATDFLRSCWEFDLTVERRIIVPYQTQQSTGAQVEWARENRRLLMLYRDLVVMVRP